MQDTEQIKSILNQTIKNHARQLQKAKNAFELALQSSISVERERQAREDQIHRTTLRALKHSGLGLCDPAHLVSQLKSGYLAPDIGVSFERQNVDLANQNF